MKRKSPSTTTPLSFDALALANPVEYPHKNYLARNYRIPGLQFYISSNFRNFRTVLPESQKRQVIVAEPETDFNAIWAFKVIQGHLFRCH